MISERRWFYLGTASVTLLFLGLIYAWSIFRAPFSEMYPSWTVSQLSLTFTISMICFCLGGFAGGILSRKLPAGKRLLLSASLLFAGFFAVSMVPPEDPGQSLMILYVFYGVFVGGGAGAAYNTLIVTINRWFPDKVGLASGIMMMGFGLGALLLGSAVNMVIGKLGLPYAFRILGIAAAAVCTAASAIIREPDAGTVRSLQKLSAADGEDEMVFRDDRNYTSSEMMRTGRFWIFMVWVVLLNSAGLLVINSAAGISAAYGGTAVLGMIVSLFNGAGRIIAGSYFDRKGRRISTGINNLLMLGAGVILTLGAVTDKYLFILMGLVLVGLAFGGCPAIISAYISRTFGPEFFPANFGIANFSVIPAAILGPMVSSVLLESADGDYRTNFYAITAFAAAALVMWVLLNMAHRSEKN